MTSISIDFQYQSILTGGLNRLISIDFRYGFLSINYVWLAMTTTTERRTSKKYRVCARRPCWRSKTIKLFSFGKKFNCHAKIILLFTPPTWPPRTDSIVRTRANGVLNKQNKSCGDHTFWYLSLPPLHH